jgi:DnaJ-class molecular chaperone
MSSTANTTKCTTCKGTGIDTNCDYDNNGNAIDIVSITCEDCDGAGHFTWMTETEVNASFEAFRARRRAGLAA